MPLSSRFAQRLLVDRMLLSLPGFGGDEGECTEAGQVPGSGLIL